MSEFVQHGPIFSRLKGLFRRKPGFYESDFYRHLDVSVIIDRFRVERICEHILVANLQRRR